MKLAILSPVAWRTPPLAYGPWEQMASNVVEGLVAEGHEVTLFATGNSRTEGSLDYIVDRPYEEDPQADAKVWECMHISYLMEKSDEFDIIHNHFDFLPLTYSRLIKTPMITTIHGFSSPKIIPVFKRYNDINHYVSISNADRSAELDYMATVYNGIRMDNFRLNENPEDYLLYFGRIHHDKGTYESIQIALKAGRKLIISGLIQDQEYFDQRIKPFLDDKKVIYIGNSGPEKRNEVLGKAVALLHPINFEEPFGLSVVEAMACGTPVIAFNKGAMSELIDPARTGFLVNDTVEAIQAINQIENLNRKDCRQWVSERFSMERMVKDYIRLYQEITV